MINMEVITQEGFNVQLLGGMTTVESLYRVRRRLCNLWTKSDDDNVETFRMGNEEDKVV